MTCLTVEDYNKMKTLILVGKGEGGIGCAKLNKHYHPKVVGILMTLKNQLL